MINIRQLILKNIGPFAEQKFDFSVTKGQPDIHIFTGANGSGKTTILHAIASQFDYFENDHKEHISNNFYKRFHFFDEDKNEMAKSYAHAVLVDKNTQKVIDKAISYGCKHCKHIQGCHEQTITNNFTIAKSGALYQHKPIHEALLQYKNAIASTNLDNQTFRFAAFAYSGYRLIRTAKIQIETQKPFNPLHLALEFVKERDTGALVTNWIMSRYSKAAIEEMQGNKVLADQYRAALNCLINAINELTNSEFRFEVKTNPWKLAIYYHTREIEFDVLPDGLRSLLSWLGDLLVRLDEIPWADKAIPVNHQHIILLLDEIEVHLHPKWQYHILPLTQKIFPNAQIFVSTHSPFILNSIDDAKIYKLQTIEGTSVLDKIIMSQTGNSYNYIYENILETVNYFSHSTTQNIARFNVLDAEIVRGNKVNEVEFEKITQDLLNEGEEVSAIISSKLFRLKKITGKDYLNGKNQ
jgi:predicted ATP-binding protein involved in virulence